MPLNYPDSSEILNRMRADIKQLLPESDPYIVDSILNVLATAQANRMKEIYDQLKLISRDTFVTTAEGDALLERAFIEGLSLLPATQSAGNVIFTGVSGSSIPFGSDLVNQDLNYEVQSSATISNISLSLDTLTSSGTTATATFSSSHGLGSGMTVTIAGANETEYNGDFPITVISATSFEYTITGSPASPATGTISSSVDMAVSNVVSVETGTQTNILGGGTLQLSNTIAGVDGEVYTQFEGVVGAEDIETTESLRARTLQKKQNPNTPYNSAEIETQALSVEGVTRVFVFEANDLVRSDAVTLTTLATGVIEVTFSSAHGLLSGTKITVSGAVEPEFNGDFRVVETSTTTLVYFSATASGTATGSPIADYSQVQLGQTAVYFVRDNDDNIIPSAAEVTEVKDKLLEIKPANTSDDNLFVLAPISSPQTFTFSALEPNTEGIRTSIQANLQSLFDGISLGDSITEIAYQTAIQNSFDSLNALGVESFTLSSPSGNLTSDYNEILTLSTVTFP